MRRKYPAQPPLVIYINHIIHSLVRSKSDSGTAGPAHVAEMGFNIISAATRHVKVVGESGDVVNRVAVFALLAPDDVHLVVDIDGADLETTEHRTADARHL